MLRLGLILCLLGVCAAQNNGLCGRTPGSLMTDFLKNCNDVVGSNCMTHWTNFEGGFARRAPETVQPSDYQPYFMAIPIRAQANQTLFWTRTEPLVKILSENNMGVTVVSSFNSPSSVIIIRIPAPSGSLNWCGNASGIDFFNPCLCNVTGRFWHQFSAQFAIAASASAFYLADGEDRDGAFRDNSFFSTVEIPSLRMGVVKRIVGLIVHRKGRGESCATGSSIRKLRQRLTDRQIAFDCYDIFAQANDTNTANATAKCVRNVIERVQKGREDKNRMITCGASALSISMLGLLVSVCICMLFKLD